MKKVLSILLSLILVLSTLTFVNIPASAETYSGSCGENLTWSLDTGTGELVISGTGDMYNYEIKITSNYYITTAPWFHHILKSVNIEEGVTSIGSNAFSMSAIRSITIPNSVTSIGEDAFSSCRALTSITIPDGVTSVGETAFWGCTALTSIDLSENNTVYSDIDGVLFNKGKTELIQYPIGNPRTDYTIPDSVTSIGSYAFSSCDSLKSIIIPKNVTSIGKSAFSSCYSLKSLIILSEECEIFNDTDTIYRSVIIYGYANSTAQDYATNFERTFSAINTKCGEGLTWSFDYNTNELTISGTGKMEDYSSQSDVPWDLYSNNIKSVIIENGVTSIGSYAFEDCTKLTSVTISNSVTSIGDYAFSGCTSLTSITIPDSVTSIGSYAFEDCTKLTSITIPKSVTSIGDYAFSGCSSLTSVTIPDSVTSIGSYAFEDCTKLTSIIIPESVTSIGDYAFSGCSSLTSVTIPDSVTSIGYYAFSGCSSLKSVTIPDSVTSIGSYAFEDCTKLTSITIPNSVTNILSSAFENCTSLRSVTIPDSVTSIGSYAFFGCTSLTNIAIPDSVTSIGDLAFGYFYHSYYYEYRKITGFKIYGYLSSSAQYYANFNEFTFCALDGKCGKGLVWILNTETGELIVNGTGDMNNYTSSSSVPWNAVREKIKSVTIENGVTSIGDYAFSGCTSLTSITIPDSVTSIGNYAFSGCTSLTSITIGNGVTSIGDSAFGACKSLTSIIIPDSVTSIGAEAFWYCASLTSVTIPDSVTSIGNYAFSSCDSLTSVYISNIEAWCEIEFGSSSSNPLYFAKELYLNNKSVTNLTIPDSITSISDYAFYNCTSLTSIIIPDSVTSIGAEAFWGCESLIKVFVPDSVTSIGTDAFKNIMIYCNQNSYAETYAIKNGLNFHAHIWIVKKEKSATYFAAGYSGDKVCSVCGETLETGKSIAKLKLKAPKFKLTGAKKKFTVKYTKVTGATGFQVRYKLGNGKWKTVNFDTKKSASKIVKNLKKGNYKVQIRAYVKQGSKKAFSNWTSTKTVKVK